MTMKSITATAAARRFSDLLDAVERRGERFVVVRRGRAIARIEPATRGQGSEVKDLLRGAPRDAGWLADVRRARDATTLEERRWLD